MSIVYVLDAQEPQLVELAKAGKLAPLVHVAQTDPKSPWKNALRLPGVSTGWLEGSFLLFWGGNIGTSDQVLAVLRKYNVYVTDSF